MNATYGSSRRHLRLHGFLQLLQRHGQNAYARILLYTWQTMKTFIFKL